MHWQNLGPLDWVVVGTIGLALLGVIPLYRSDMRLRKKRHAAWHDAYFHQGGLIRQLIGRWTNGRPRITDRGRGPRKD